MVVYLGTTKTLREEIQKEQTRLLSLKDGWNWEDVKRHYEPVYGKGLTASPEEVLEKIKKLYLSSVGYTPIRCAICDKFFELDERITHIYLDSTHVDRGEWYAVNILFHKKCMETLIKDK